MQLKHQEELGKRLKMNINTEKKLIKEVSQVKKYIFISVLSNDLSGQKQDKLSCVLRLYKKHILFRAMRLNGKPLRQR